MTPEEKIHHLRLAILGLMTFQKEIIALYTPPRDDNEAAWLRRAQQRFDEADKALDKTQ